MLKVLQEKLDLLADGYKPKLAFLDVLKRVILPVLSVPPF